MNKRGLHKRLEADAIWLPRKALLKWLYNDQQWSHSQVADYFGMSQTGIGKVMRRLGIPARGKANYGKKNGRYKDGKQSRLYRQMIEKDLCENCKSVDDLVIHHRDGDHYNNKLSNLCVLCGSCHNSYHKKLWWDRQGTSKIKRSSDGKFERKFYD